MRTKTRWRFSRKDSGNRKKIQRSSCKRALEFFKGFFFTPKSPIKLDHDFGQANNSNFANNGSRQAGRPTTTFVTDFLTIVFNHLAACP